LECFYAARARLLLTWSAMLLTRQTFPSSYFIQ
jgi:hypothetical protein